MRFLGGCFSLLVATQILRDGGLFSVIPLLINCSSNSYLSFRFIASFAFVLQMLRAKPISLCRGGFYIRPYREHMECSPTIQQYYNTNRQRKQSLCRNLIVGETIGRPFLFCVFQRAIRESPLQNTNILMRTSLKSAFFRY